MQLKYPFSLCLKIIGTLLILSFYYSRSYSQEISIPFTSSEFKTDAQTFKAMGIGKHNDPGTARKISILQARAELAALINIQIKSSIKYVVAQYETEAGKNLEKVFLSVTSSEVNQVLIGSEIMAGAEKAQENKDGTTTYYVVVSLPKKRF